MASTHEKFNTYPLMDDFFELPNAWDAAKVHFLKWPPLVNKEMVRSMMSHLVVLLSVPLFMLLNFKNANAQPSPRDMSINRKIIEEKNRQYFTSVEKKDLKAFEQQYSVDSWIMVPNAPIYCGPDAPADYFNNILLKEGISKGKFITIDLYGVGTEIMVEVGFYQFYDSADKQFDDGKYIVVWKKSNEQWKRFRETITSSRKN